MLLFDHNDSRFAEGQTQVMRLAIDASDASISLFFLLFGDDFLLFGDDAGGAFADWGMHRKVLAHCLQRPNRALDPRGVEGRSRAHGRIGGTTLEAIVPAILRPTVITLYLLSFTRGHGWHPNEAATTTTTPMAAMTTIAHGL